MKIIDVVSKESLFLLDEIGSGTDFVGGVSLSTSILQHFPSCVNLAMATTHYADLCHLETIDSGFKNAAMQFYRKTLKPTYKYYGKVLVIPMIMTSSHKLQRV